jgi:hypothetical protein
MGRTVVVSVAGVGRIGIIWNLAEYVIEYERHSQ